MDIYKELAKAGCELSNWCSDLYTPVSDVSKAIIDKYEYKQNVTTFHYESKPWYDIPFAYYPYHANACVV